MADVRYSSVEEIRSAISALIRGSNEYFTDAQALKNDYLSSTGDPTLPGARQKQQSWGNSRGQERYSALSEGYNNNIRTEYDEIKRSIDALPTGDERNAVAFLMGEKVLPVVDTAGYEIKSAAALFKQNKDIAIAEDAKRGTETTAEGTEATPASATDTATNQVANTNPQAAASSSGSNAAPANVPENQLSGSQRANLVKSQLSRGGGSASIEDAGVAVAASKSEANTADRFTTAPSTVTGAKYRPNPLHQYPSYTYALSLHLLDRDTFNTMVDSGEYIATNVLVASAGRWNEASGSKAFNRNARFKEDFYFEDLDVHTIIGLGETNRATNAIDVKFTLIEPYGFTFIDRIMNASRDLDILNYLQNPYMLQIDFYATEEDGTVRSPVPNITKNIPVRMLSCEAEVTNKGSEYRIQCLPFNHQAFDQTVSQTPINVEVIANTVEGFFKTTATGAQNLASQMADAADQREEYNNSVKEVQQRLAQQDSGGVGVVPLTARILPQKYSKDAVYKAQSYGDVLNAHMRAIQIRQRLPFVDRYEFRFDKVIADADLLQDQKISPNDRPMTDLKEAYKTILDQKIGAWGGNEIKTAINAGSSVEAVISRVIRNSSYILNQLNEIANQIDQKKYSTSQEALETIGLNWYKIIPSIKLIDFDPYTNTWAREITYNIVPYRVFNVRIDQAPQGKVTQNDCVKFYDYIYTGSNNDIIEFKLNLNAAYYTSITAYKENMASVSGVLEYWDTGTSCDINKPIRSKFTAQPVVKKYKLPDQRAIASGRTHSVEELTASDLEQTLHVDARADHLTCTLKIIGDPEFIKQDDLFIKPQIGSDGYIVSEVDRTRTKNGSIITDRGEVYCQLTIKTPIDIDDETGLMLFDQTRTSAFSGIFRVMEVHNSFSRGQFTQELTLVRMQDQETENQTNKERTDIVATTPPALASAATQAATDAPVSETPPAEANDENGRSQSEPATVPDPAPEPNQAELAQIRDSAPEQPITQNTEPPQIAPSTTLTEEEQLKQTIMTESRKTLTPTTTISGLKEKLTILENNNANYEKLAAYYTNNGQLEKAAKVNAALQDNKNLVADFKAQLAAI